MKPQSDDNKARAECDIVVVGAGVAGLSAGFFLSQGASVTVLEAEEQPAYHSSGRSAALYIEGYENEVVAGLTAMSGNFFKQPPAAFSQTPLLHDRGGLTVAASDEMSRLTTYLDRWQPLCPSMQLMSVAQCVELVPVLRPEKICGGVYDPDWKAIDTHAFR